MSFFESIKQQSLASWSSHKILPSVVVSQFMLESGWRPGGSLSGLANAPYHNLFGIKASSDWTGRTVNMPTREVGPQGSYWINADFRAYDSWSDSLKDHAAFFSNTEWRRNNYRFVVGEKDYKAACRALQAAGYATDPSYASKLISMIEAHKLYELDAQVLNAGGTVQVEAPQIEAKTTNKTVGGVLGQAARDESKKLDVTVVGDEIGVGTLPYLQNRFKSLNSDCANARTLVQGASAIQSLKQNNRLARYVVVILGTNGTPTKQHLESLIAAAGGEHKILLVDTASEVAHRQELTNLYYDASVRHQSVYFVNWGAYAFSRSTHFYSGRVMTNEGYSRHAEYIVQAVYEASSGSFTGRILQQTNKNYHGIESIEYDYEGLYSPKGQSIIYNAEANDRWGFRAGDGGRPLWIDGFFEMSSEARPGTLMTEALKYMKAHSVPELQYTVPLAIMPDSLSIGDRGVFIDHEFNPPLAIEATVLEITTSDTDPASNSVVIGNVVELFAEDNDELEKMKRELAQIREERKQEYRKGQPIKFTCESSAGLILQEDSKTQLVVVGKQGVFEVPSLYLRYRWERESADDDTAYNQMLANTQHGPVLEVYAKDVVSDETTFYCRVYDEDGQLVGVTGATLSIAKRGKSAYETWLDAGNLGTEQEFLQKLKGADGKDGVGLPGSPGADGRTSYTHIAYADGTQGENFTTGEPGNRAYMGTYSDFVQADSTDYTRYRWVRIKGADGRTSYTHIAYADSADGTKGFSFTETQGKKYMGTYTDFSANASTSPSRYKWIKMAQAYADEFQSELDSKANQRETDEYLNHIRGEIQKQRQEQEALASMQALNEVVKELHLIREAYARDGKASAEKLTEALNKLAKIENDLGEFAVRFNFINLMMQFSDEGFVIGNKTKGTYMIFTDEQIDIFNNGVRVAFIKGGTLQFVQGIFIERVQIGSGMLGSYESDPDIVVLRWIGRGNA
ncbi:glucosaminidase domain-containing protein [Aerococcaceae bacterium NML191219]|nr:glucosaminidase domain-containing protein [Aerococcaceae bacterium NML191219]